MSNQKWFRNIWLFKYHAVRKSTRLVDWSSGCSTPISEAIPMWSEGLNGRMNTFPFALKGQWGIRGLWAISRNVYNWGESTVRLFREALEPHSMNTNPVLNLQKEGWTHGRSFFSFQRKPQPGQIKPLIYPCIDRQLVSGRLESSETPHESTWLLRTRPSTGLSIFKKKKIGWLPT